MLAAFGSLAACQGTQVGRGTGRIGEESAPFGWGNYIGGIFVKRCYVGLAAGLCVCALAFAACGGGSDDGDKTVTGTQTNKTFQGRKWSWA